MSDEVVLGFRAEGIPQTRAEVEALERVMERLNAGSPAGPGGPLSTLPTGAPMNAPRLSNGLDAYNTSPGVTAPPPVAATPTLTPYAPPTAPPAPGAYAPDPYGGGTPATGSTTVHAQNVTVVASPGAGGGFNGGGGVIPPGGSAPPPGGYGPVGGGPFNNWSPFPTGPGSTPQNLWQLWQQWHSQYNGFNPVQSIMQRIPLPANFGVPATGLGNLPLMPTVAAVGAGFGIADYAQSIYYAAQQAPFQAETDIMSAAARGQYLSPVQQRYARGIAELRSVHDATNAAYAPIFDVTDKIPFLGSIIRRNWQMDFEQTYQRDLQLAESRGQADQMRMRMGALAGGGAYLPDDPLLSLRYGLSGRAGLFGRRAVRSLGVAGLGRYLGMSGFMDEDLQSALGSIYDASGAMGNDALYNSLASGASPDTLAQSAAAYFIATGNRQGIQSLQSVLGQGYDSSLAAAENVFRAGEQINIAQSGISSIGSNIAYMGATGVGFRTIASTQRRQAAAYNAAIAGKQQELTAAQASGNPVLIAQKQAELDSLTAQQAQTAAGAVQTYYGGRGTEIQAAQTSAENLFQFSMYGGTPHDVNFAFEQRRGATLLEARRLEALANESITPPEQAMLLRSQAEALRQQASIGIGREQQQFNYSVTQGRIGVAGALANEASTRANLFGSPEDIYAAGIGQANIIRQNLSAVQGQLQNNPYLSPTERLDLQRQEIELRRQLNQSLTENLRNFDQLNIAVASTGLGIAQTRGAGAMQYLGVGGSGAAPYVMASSAAAAQVFRQSQQYLRDLDAQGVDHNSKTYQDALAAVELSRNQARAVNDSLASVPFSAESRDIDVVGRTRLNVLSNTYAGWGDIRGTVSGLLANTGQQLRETNANRARIPQMVDEEIRQGVTSAADRQRRIAELNLQFDQTTSGLVNQAVGLQSQLENGWMDRLISQSINMPGRGSMVARGFTNFEAAPFLQAMSSAFGFAGPSGLAARDYYLHRGDRLANTLVGNVTRPEGFLDTAMSGATMPDGTPMHTNPNAVPGLTTLGRGTGTGTHLGTIQIAPIEIIIKDTNGKVIGRGSSRGTVHDLANGSLTVVQSPHATGVSRQ